MLGFVVVLVLVLDLVFVAGLVGWRCGEQLRGAATETFGVLDYERLDVYRCSIQLATIAFTILDRLPSGHHVLSDQLRRAVISVPLNIAEGSGKTSVAERRRFHTIARGSAMECAAIVDLLRMQRLIDDPTSREAKELATRVVSMLSKMSR